jgi:hypothetical protein
MLSVGILPFHCAVVNHKLNAQLVLQPHPYVAEKKVCLKRRKNFNLTKNTTWKERMPWQTGYQIICLTENKELSNNCCQGTQRVTHTLTHPHNTILPHHKCYTTVLQNWIIFIWNSCPERQTNNNVCHTSYQSTITMSAIPVISPQ